MQTMWSQNSLTAGSRGNAGSQGSLGHVLGDPACCYRFFCVGNKSNPGPVNQVANEKSLHFRRQVYGEVAADMFLLRYKDSWMLSIAFPAQGSHEVVGAMQRNLQGKETLRRLLGGLCNFRHAPRTTTKQRGLQLSLANSHPPPPPQTITICCEVAMSLIQRNELKAAGSSQRNRPAFYSPLELWSLERLKGGL